jgi:ribosomal protein S18 acetylase RimI-like enzyme
MTDGDVGEVLRIERAGAVLDAFVVPWDSAALGVPAAQIRELSLPPATGGDRRDPDDQLADELLGAFDAWCREHDVRFAACRLDHLRIRESIALERADFRFVETTYEVGLDDLGIVATPAADVVIERVRPGDPDLAAAIAIAGSAFTTGRFAVDPRLDPAVNGRRYAAWVASSAAAERQIVLGARLLGEVVGFFVVEDVAADTVYWHLTAVAPAAQGRGIGRSLWQAMVARHRAAGARSIRTTISGHNLPVINLYARLGFRFVGSGQTLHRVWTADAAAARAPAEGRP